MKKIYSILISGLFLIGECLAQDTPLTIYTPKGSSVLAYNMVEASNTDRQALDDHFATAYPAATQIKTGTPPLSSSRKYNCHGYAWHIVEGGAQYWIGYSQQTDEDIYMSDGSYIRTCSETYPGKVSWGSGDHTAVTTSVSGVYKSKWRDYPLMHHAWNISPYGTSNLQYYASTKISGSTSPLCSGTRTFTVQNISGATYTWSVNTNVLTIVSGQGTSNLVVQKNGSNHGDGWVEVQISTSCSGGSKTSKREYFDVGTPNVSSISVDASMCNGYGQTVTATILGNPTFSQWSVTSGNASNSYLTNYGSGACYFNSYVNDCYGLQIQLTNACGSHLDGTTICVDNCFARYSIYPNPAKDFISIKFDQYDRVDVMPSQLRLYSEKDQKVVYEIDQSQIFAATSSDGLLKVDVKSLPRGTYYIHLTSGKQGDEKVEKTRILLE